MPTPQNFLLAIENGTPRLINVSSSWRDMIDAHERHENHRIAAGTPASELHFVVRQLDDHQGLVRQALDAVKLTPKQAKVLAALAERAPASGRRGFRPNGDSVAGYYSTDVVATARALERKGLVTVHGMKGAPKTYFVTSLGRAVAQQPVAA